VPASCITCANSSAVNGDSSLGLSTTVQPAASAGATLAVIWYSGQFHGVISAQTPIGSLRTWMPLTSLLEGEIAQHLDRHADMLDPEVALPGAGKADRRAHLGDDRLGELLRRSSSRSLIRVSSASRSATGLCEKWRTRGAPPHRRIDIRRRAGRDMPDHLFGDGIAHGDPRRIGRSTQAPSI
jgi:hypothetical protein